MRECEGERVCECEVSVPGTRKTCAKSQIARNQEVAVIKWQPETARSVEFFSFERFWNGTEGRVR